jgi:hypothetical protein
MKSVDVREHMNWEITQEEFNERVAWMKVRDEELRIANEKSPLPDDFIEYVKGRKTLLTAASVPRGGTA